MFAERILKWCKHPEVANLLFSVCEKISNINPQFARQVLAIPKGTGKTSIPKWLQQKAFEKEINTKAKWFSSLAKRPSEENLWKSQNQIVVDRRNVEELTGIVLEQFIEAGHESFQEKSIEGIIALTEKGNRAWGKAEFAFYDGTPLYDVWVLYNETVKDCFGMIFKHGETKPLPLKMSGEEFYSDSQNSGFAQLAYEVSREVFNPDELDDWEDYLQELNS